MSSTSGTSNSNSANDNTVKGGLTSRNSFIGVASPTWGSIKLGKTDAPYKNSTARMNAFNGMLGDYAVIMGNTGGDNRVEFGTRLDHALWYDSPNFNGFSFNALVSPGQNRATDNSNIAAGEAGCAGGNAPNSGIAGGDPVACTGGAYGTAYSASANYSSGPLYLTAAYELHKKVNRTSDEEKTCRRMILWTLLTNRQPKLVSSTTFSTNTVISAIYEDMRRKLSDPSSLGAGDWQNERDRSGYWLALSQKLTEQDTLHLGWAHANKAKGDPGVHNTGDLVTPGVGGYDNSANMYTMALVHQVDKKMSVYANYAATINHDFAHYDLGAGRRTDDGLS